MAEYHLKSRWLGLPLKPWDYKQVGHRTSCQLPKDLDNCRKGGWKHQEDNATRTGPATRCISKVTSYRVSDDPFTKNLNSLIIPQFQVVSNGMAANQDWRSRDRVQQRDKQIRRIQMLSGIGFPTNPHLALGHWGQHRSDTAPI